jgi:hypothetical protein
MVRFLLLLISTLLIAAAAMTLQSCGSESVEAAPAGGPANRLIVLPDGSTMVVSHGSMTREIADWLISPNGSTRAEFPFSGFHEHRPAMTSAGLGRAADLATLLRASPAATIELAGDEARAKSLAKLLADQGIANDRMRIVPAAGPGLVMLTIDRGARAPLRPEKN